MRGYHTFHLHFIFTSLYENTHKKIKRKFLKFTVVCCCKLNNTQICDEHLLTSPNTNTGCYQLPDAAASKCTARYTNPGFGIPGYPRFITRSQHHINFLTVDTLVQRCQLGLNLVLFKFQVDGAIIACCATGTSTRDSLLSWIRFLQRDNPDLVNTSYPYAVYFDQRMHACACVCMVENDQKH